LHEWSIAEGVVRTVLAYTEGRGIARVEEVVVSIGELSQLDLDIVREALNMLSNGTLLEGARFVFVVERARFKCTKCGATWGFDEVRESVEKGVGVRVSDTEGGEDLPLHYLPELIYAYTKCPRCGSRDFEVTGGLGVKVVRLKVVKDND